MVFPQPSDSTSYPGRLNHTHDFPWNLKLKQESYTLAFFPLTSFSLWMVISIYLGDNLNSTFSLNSYIPLARVPQILLA